MNRTRIEQLEVGQKFLLGDQDYFVISVEYVFDLKHYVVVARSQHEILWYHIELKIPSATPFTTFLY